MALAILLTALTGVAELLSLSVRRARESGVRGSAVTAAQAKLEWLGARTFGYAEDGSPVTDEALTPSPSGALDEDTSGYADAVDANGRDADALAGGIVWRRRWAVTEVDPAEPETVAIEVCVFRPSGDDRPGPAAEACVSTLRTRQP